MRQKRADLLMLLAIFSVLGASVGILGIKQRRSQNRPRKEFSYLDAAQQIKEYLYARAVDPLARVMLQYPNEIVRELTEKKVVAKNSPLEDKEKIEFFVALLHYYNRAGRNLPVMDWLYKQKELLGQMPAFLAAAQNKAYNADIPFMSKWLRHHGGNDLEEWTYEAMSKAIEENDYAAFETMYKLGLRLDQQGNTNLLIEAVEQDAQPNFIRFLVRRGAKIDAVKDGHTVLMLAVRNGNPKMVAELLAHGADPRIIADANVGSALQIAFQNDFVAIEKLLRDYGARD